MRMKSSFCAVMLFGCLVGSASACDEESNSVGFGDEASIQCDEGAADGPVLPNLPVPGTRPPGSGFNPPPPPPMPPPGAPAPGGGSTNPNSLVVAREVDAESTCDTREETRLARANAMANQHVSGARRGRHFVVTLADGNSEVWQYVCGGRFCRGTVLDNYPVESDCN